MSKEIKDRKGHDLRWTGRVIDEGPKWDSIMEIKFKVGILYSVLVSIGARGDIRGSWEYLIIVYGAWRASGRNRDICL